MLFHYVWTRINGVCLEQDYNHMPLLNCKSFFKTLLLFLLKVCTVPMKFLCSQAWPGRRTIWHLQTNLVDLLLHPTLAEGQRQLSNVTLLTQAGSRWLPFLHASSTLDYYTLNTPSNTTSMPLHCIWRDQKIHTTKIKLIHPKSKIKDGV
jgi:hypothetical protein